MPNVSIIMPVYNLDSYLEKSILSILNQTYRDFELILIDQGSTDNSLSIMEKYQEDYKEFIVLITQQNYGTSACLNLGIDKSNSPFIMFVDGDDYLHEEFLELMMEEAQETDADLVLTNARIIDDKDEKLLKICFCGQMKERVESIYENKDLLNSIWPSSWGKLYKKSIFIDNKIHFPLGLRNQDLGTIPRLLPYCNKIAKVNRALYHYNYRQNYDIKNHNYKLLDTAKNLRLVKNHYQEKRLNEEFDQQLEYLFIEHLLLRATKRAKLISDPGIRAELTEEIYQILKKGYPNWMKNPKIESLSMGEKAYLKLVYLKNR